MKLLQRLKNLFLPEGKVSDGFHSFDELYHYRMLYNAAFFNSLGERYEVHKSYRHADGELCFEGGWFIVMANLPTGQVTITELKSGICSTFLKDGKLMNGMAILQLRLQTDYTGSLYIMTNGIISRTID